jgi:hypothetical protein
MAVVFERGQWCLFCSIFRIAYLPISILHLFLFSTGPKNEVSGQPALGQPPGGESGDLFSAAPAVTFEAIAPAAAVEATVDSVVATAEAPANAVGGARVQTTGGVVSSTEGEVIASGAAAGTVAFKGDFSKLTRQQRKDWWKKHRPQKK